MCTRMLKLLFFGILAAALSGCTGSGQGSVGPDLVPVRALGNPTFCERNPAGDLLIYVKNKGNADAPSSAVEVQFFNVQPGYSPKVRAIGETGPLQAGETSSYVISVKIPEGCFNPDCDFIITVDIDNKVKETDEQNNSSKGACVG